MGVLGMFNALYIYPGFLSFFLFGVEQVRARQRIIVDSY